MEEVVAELEIPVSADRKGKHAGQLADDFLAALGDAGKNGDGAEYGDEPEQPLLIAHFLEVKSGWRGPKKMCPRQKKAHTQTEGAQIDQRCPG